MCYVCNNFFFVERKTLHQLDFLIINRWLPGLAKAERSGWSIFTIEIPTELSHVNKMKDE